MSRCSLNDKIAHCHVLYFSYFFKSSAIIVCISHLSMFVSVGEADLFVMADLDLADETQPKFSKIVTGRICMAWRLMKMS